MFNDLFQLLIILITHSEGDSNAQPDHHFKIVYPSLLK